MEERYECYEVFGSLALKLHKRASGVMLCLRENDSEV